MKRIFHPWTKWEEVTNGMWRIVSAQERDAFAIKAANLMRDIPAFESAMRKASEQWINSSEHNLTDLSQNRKAWLGHAGNCVALDSPEDATRQGWGMLNQEEQDKANAAAERIIKEWEDRQCQSKNLEFLF